MPLNSLCVYWLRSPASSSTASGCALSNRPQATLTAVLLPQISILYSSTLSETDASSSSLNVQIFFGHVLARFCSSTSASQHLLQPDEKALLISTIGAITVL